MFARPVPGSQLTRGASGVGKERREYQQSSTQPTHTVDATVRGPSVVGGLVCTTYKAACDRVHKLWVLVRAFAVLACLFSIVKASKVSVPET